MLLVKAMSADSLSVGKLVSLETKLGVAVCSDSCKRMNTPCVTVLARIDDGRGVVRDTTFEMSLAQFQQFAKSFKDIAALMETL